MKSYINATYFPYPLEIVQQKATRQYYYHSFRGFFYYIYHISWLVGRLHRSIVDLTRLKLSQDQYTIMQSIQKGFTSLLSEPKSDDLKFIVKSSLSTKIFIYLIKNLFQLIVIFQTNLPSISQTLQRSAIVYYLKVLNIHPYELSFREAYDYTLYLVALIQIGCLIMLEYSLPYYQYQYLIYPQLARSSYPNQL